MVHSTLAALASVFGTCSYWQHNNRAAQLPVGSRKQVFSIFKQAFHQLRCAHKSSATEEFNGIPELCATKAREPVPHHCPVRSNYFQYEVTTSYS